MTLVEDRSRIAGRFLAARRAAAGLDDYPGDFPATLDEAYAIQDEAIARWGRPVIGWKVGRVPPPLIERFGTDRLAGPIFAEQPARGNGARRRNAGLRRGLRRRRGRVPAPDRRGAARRARPTSPSTRPPT